MEKESPRLSSFDPLPADLERSMVILESLPEYKRRQWLKRAGNYHPRFVYRYMGHEKFLSDYLVECRFYLSSVVDFNDPFDMGAYVTVSNDWKKKREKFKRILKVQRPQLNWKQRREELDKMMCAPNHLQHVQRAYERSIMSTGAICFTTEPRNLLMWSHYAVNHCGFVLQFNIANDIRIMSRLMKVEYSDTYPAISWADDNPEILEKVFRTKHGGWKYEDEFRILLVDGAKTYLKFKPEVVTGLIFGCRAAPELKRGVLKILETRTSKRLSPIKIYQAVKHKSAYQILIQRDRSLRWPS